VSVGRGERRLEGALANLARALDESHAPWMVIGGIAIIARGVRRMTAEIDAVIQGDAVDAEEPALVDALEAAIAEVNVEKRGRKGHRGGALGRGRRGEQGKAAKRRS
jgi:hypothetical protein